VLRKIFGPKRDEVMEELRRLLNEELHDLYSYPNIILAIKLRTMERVEHEAHMGKNKDDHTRLW